MLACRLWHWCIPLVCGQLRQWGDSTGGWSNSRFPRASPAALDHHRASSSKQHTQGRLCDYAYFCKPSMSQAPVPDLHCLPFSHITQIIEALYSLHGANWQTWCLLGGQPPQDSGCSTHCVWDQNSWSNWCKAKGYKTVLSTSSDNL